MLYSYAYIPHVSYPFYLYPWHIHLLSPASLAGAEDIETHRVRPSVRPSVRPDEFVQAISQLLFTVGG